MAKLPWMKFFPLDFMRDTRGLSPEAKGIWIDLICFMWNSETRGRITMEFSSLSRMVGCSEECLNKSILEFISQNICEILTERNGFVTVISRRMKREEKDRENTRLRVDKHRQKRECNADVTPPCNGHVTPQKLEVRSKKLEVIKEKDLKEVLLKHKKTFSEAYPGIELDQETAKAQAWIESNPKNKKSNLKRFLNNWLSKAQDNTNKYPPKEDKFL